ncbi:hypothetical protein GP475_08875 [Corynebacterium poyangense]|uniref:RecT family protein n=1 Tax=Corynebacterium poyangense TaxID=2684405 RepID=A0A7H0SQB4_9CORY|nr:hypothetical protein [Corynebacterium poyangense]QNQ90739.1 hypothetical protein GP475_08875 [Corynebacterium poyangense]
MSNDLTPVEGEIMSTPDVTDNGLELLKMQAEAMQSAHQLATGLCATQMVPSTYRDKPDDGAAAILYGAELGLKPLQALQQIFVVRGKPAIYARTMVALLKAKGYTFSTVEDTPEAVTVRGTSPSGETEEARWTLERAKRAGYTKSNEKYQTDPQAMLYAKAASEVCRKLAPDVLLGVTYSAEELELEPAPVRATARRVVRDTESPTQRLARQLEATKTADGQGEYDSILERIEAAESQEIISEIMQNLPDMEEEHREKIRAVANTRWEQLAQNGGDNQ